MSVRRAVIDFRHVLAWLVFLIWAGVFAFFYFSGSYVEFLNPQFSWLMISGLLLCALFFVVLFMTGPASDTDCCGHDHHHHGHGPSVLRMLILLVPVLFAMNYGSWQLGTFAFDKRAVGLTRMGGSNDSRAATAIDMPASTAASAAVELVAAARPVTLVEIHNRFEHLVDKKIITQGMYMSETPGLPQDSWVIFRFLIVCCAADAQPMAVMIKGPRPVGIADEAWVEVEGTLRGIELNGQPAVAVEADKVSSIVAPKVPYMVPNFR